MNRILTIGLVAGLALATMHVASSGQAPPRTSGVLSVLEAGQSVNLSETPEGYQIKLFGSKKQMLGHEVVEVASDFVVLRDIAKVQETRIPLWSIKSVVVILEAAQSE